MPHIDPIPFLIAGYGAAVLVLSGFYAWVRLERRKLRQKMAVARRESKHG